VSVLSDEPVLASVARPSRFLDVAGEVLARERYLWTRMDDVAAACGVSKPYLYRFFRSKAGLYEAVVRRFDDAVAAAVAGTPGSCGLTVLLEVLDHQRHLWSVTFDPTAPFLPGDESAVSGCRERLSGLVRLALPVTSGSSGGATVLRSPRDERLDRAIHHGAGRALVDWWVEHPEESVASLLDRLARISR
jgi:AcrR family transcriptional regulator